MLHVSIRSAKAESLFRSLFLNGSLSSSQTCDRHTEGAAGNIVQAYIVAELNGGRIAAVLAADAEMDVRTGLAAQLSSHLNQLAYAVLIQMCEGIGLIDLLLIVIIQELACIITAEAEGHLGQVVGAEAEEFGFLSDLVCSQSCAGDHTRSRVFILHVDAGFSNDLIGSGGNNVLNIFELFDFAHQGDHNQGLYSDTGLLGYVDSCVDNSSGLHLSNFRIGNSQTAATMTHHGVELVEASDNILQLVHSDVQFTGDLNDILFLSGEELVERRIQEANW